MLALVALWCGRLHEDLLPSDVNGSADFQVRAYLQVRDCLPVRAYTALPLDDDEVDDDQGLFGELASPPDLLHFLE